MSGARPIEIEPWSNRAVIHRLAAAGLPLAIRARIHPNLVTGAGLLFGLAAGLAYTQWTDWRYATLGLLLMLGWLVMDGLDGQLARATGQTSDLGRLLDGVADYSTFVAVYLALALTHPTPALAVPLAAAAGLAHALQSQFYEGERATYIRRRAGRFTAIVRPETGGFVERWYNRGEALLANRTRPFDAVLADAPPARRAALLAAWQPRAAATLLAMSPLSSNGRAFAIWVAALLGEPLVYWLWELVGLTVIALAANRRLRQAEAVGAPPETPAAAG